MYIIYHANCPDGFMAAFTCWLKYPDAHFIPRAYGSSTPLDIPDDQEIMIVDFSLPRDELIALAQRSKGVTVIDHHKTFLEDCSDLIVDKTFISLPNLNIVFDLTKCGAVLTWQYLFSDLSMPKIYEYVQDRDLWQWKLPNSREISAALFLEPKDFEYYEENIYDVLQNALIERLKNRGEAILEVQKMYVEKLAGNATIINVGGHLVPATNAPILMSEVGEELINRFPDCPFAATFHYPKGLGNGTSWSLRSKGDFDVSAVAKIYGGGGHKNAAGFIAVTL